MTNKPPELWFEDFPLGASATFGSYEVTASEVETFARAFDPQAIHLDPQAADHSLLGGLSASGWHTCSMLMRMMCDAFLLRSSSLGSPGISELNWLRPVRPGDILSARYTCVSARASASRHSLGICEFDYEVFAATETVLTARVTHLFQRREVTQRDAP